MPVAKKTAAVKSGLSVKDRLKASGLKLKASDIKALEVMVPELETSAGMIRKERSYLEEPIQTLRLWARA